MVQVGQNGTMLSRMLASAGSKASSKQGAEALLVDSKFLALVLDALRRPASGMIYTQWASGSDLMTAVRIGADILRWTYDSKESGTLLQSILAAAKACLAIQPKTTASIAKALADAESEAASKPCILFDLSFISSISSLLLDKKKGILSESH